MSSPKPQPGIMDISLYQGGASKIAGVERPIKLSSNENPYGPSPAAVEALQRAAHDLHRYPSTDHAPLRAAIAKVHDLDAEKIICGVGSDEIITFLCQAYAGVGDEVIYTEHGFAMYRISALAAGATPVEVPEQDRTVDVDAIIAACNDKTRLVFIANPANPTGTVIDLDAINRLADGIPAHVILVLDGAYAEFYDGYDGGVATIDARENVFMTRTFSKLYGLGGLRVGWGYGPKEIVDTLNRVRGPFNLSGPALAAAEAAVKDQTFAKECIAKNEHLRSWLIEALTKYGVESDPSYANFILARFKDSATATACNEHLMKNGLLVRAVAGYGLPNALRITVGDEPSCRQVAHAIGQFMADQQ